MDSDHSFIGRREERTAFGRALATARQGKLQVVLFSGPPGIGKTRLAAEVCGDAEEAGFLVLRGAWREDVELPEHWVWRQLLRRLLQALDLVRPGMGLDTALVELSALLPELRDERPDLAPPLSGDGAPSRLRLLDAGVRLLRRAAERQPLLLLLDNLHLAGPASLELLTGLFEELSVAPVILLGAFRDLPAVLRGPFLSFLGSARSRPCIYESRLGNLAPEEAFSLLEAERAGPLPRELREEVLRLTRGNPLFVREAGRLFRGRATPGDTERRRVRAHDLPKAVGAAVALRYGRLSAGCREALGTAAVIGEHFRREEILLAAPGMAPLDGQLDEAIANGFLETGEGAGEFRFTHAVLREAIRLEVPASRRREISGQLAEAVERLYAEDLPGRALSLAGWWTEAGGTVGESRARHFTRIAASKALAAGAWEQAAALYRRLLPAGDAGASNEEEAEILLGLGRALFLGGERPSAFPCLQKAFSWFRLNRRLDRLVQIATLPGYLHSGEPGFFNLVEEVLATLPAGSTALGSVLHFKGIVQFNNLGDYDGAAETLRRAGVIGEETADCRLQAVCLTAGAFVDLIRYRTHDARAKLDAADPLVAGSTDTYAVIHSVLVRSNLLVAEGRPHEAVPYMDRWIELALRSRDAFAIGSAHFSRSHLEMMAGNWESARRFIDAGLGAAPDHVFLLAFRASMEYTIGDFQAGDSFRQRILAIARRTPAGPYNAHLYCASTAVVRARQSDERGELAQHLAVLRSMARDPRAHPFIGFRARLLLGFTAALLGHAEESRRAYRAVRELPALSLVRPYHRERILGLAAHASGDHPAAEAHFREALRWVRHFADRPLEAWILCELGETLVCGCGDEERAAAARQLLRGSLEAARRLGMLPLARRVQLKLENGHPSCVHLTRREQQVLALVAQGQTNEAIAARLSISHYTAANHVRHILEKTGTANRTEAAALACRLGMVE